jgi:hypothetical protein
MLNTLRGLGLDVDPRKIEGVEVPLIGDNASIRLTRTN